LSDIITLVLNDGSDYIILKGKNNLTLFIMALMYRSVVFADSPFNPTATEGDWINTNQNSLVLDLNTTDGAIVINLPSIDSLLYGTNAGKGGFTFFIKGNIVAQDVAGANDVTINAYNSQGNTDLICGAASASVGGVGHDVGTCFHLFIAGLHSWCIHQCANHGS